VTGRRILLVGGTGGLGHASAELLTADGAELVISYYRQHERAATMQAIGHIVQADITAAADRTRLLIEAGPIDGLVVFAGNAARVTDPTELEARMAESYQSNYAGPLLLAREVAEHWRAEKAPGAIVLFASMQGTGLFPGSTAYAGAKAALIHGAKILARELRAPWNIRVNVIAPGIIQAGMAEASIASGKYDRYLQEGVIARYGQPGDIARAVRFLLELDSYITGQVLQVDGGFTL
jgi:NAD(P)-dependent dehydrogenase (short-subunit alcohol dehydrogenase family)